MPGSGVGASGTKVAASSSETGTRAETTLMYMEAAEAPSVAERQLQSLGGPMRELGQRLRELDPLTVITCARGSSDHAATFAKYLIETHAGVPVASHAPSTSSIYGTAWRGLDRVLFLAISQSGRSPDLIVSARAAKDAGALVVALVNDRGSPLAEVANVAIPLLAGPERSVAATKSYVASLLAVAALVAEWRQDADLSAALRGAPSVLRDAWAHDWSPALATMTGATNLFVVGRGSSFGIAQEAALKLKETCGLHAEAYSAAEVKHGPMAIVGAGFPVLMLVPNDAARNAFEPLARDFVDRGAIVTAAGADWAGVLMLPVVQDLHPALAPIASILSFYKLAARLSIARGLHPDHPPHLRKITETR